jgi:hypothetical protein
VDPALLAVEPRPARHADGVVVTAGELLPVASVEQCARDDGDGGTARDAVALRQLHRRELHHHQG